MRLERDQGLSFLEFNYPLLQGYDFLELYRRRGCRLQVGGADQWFNIISGTDLIRRIEGVEAWGLTSPLLLNASGQKMGKTASGAVWLDADKLKPYDYAQYWYNCDDRDVEKLLKLFTFLPLEQIAEVMQGDIRAAKRVLADEATAIVHPHVDIPEFPTVFPTTVIAVMVGANLAKSKSDARRLIEQGGVSTPEGKVTSFDAVLAGPTELKVGKKHTIRVVAGSVVG
jgi:tyrosyl-tRNA synthetase